MTIADRVVECPVVSRPYPDQWLEASRALLARTVGEFEGVGHFVAEMLISRYPHEAELVESAAHELGVEPASLMLAQVSYELATGFGCSTLALATPNGPMIARNMDWYPEDAIAQASCIIATTHGQQAGFVGNIGVVTGLSQRGFALALNAVGTADPKLTGYPMLLFLRRILDEATDFDHALEWLQREPLAAGGMITLVGMTNDQRAVVERMPNRSAVRRATGDEPLATTNDYRLLQPTGWLCPRYARLAHLYCPGQCEVDTLLGWLTDEQVMQSITAQHIIAKPRENLLRMWVPRHLLRS